LWVVYHVAAALVGAGVIVFIARFTGPRLARGVRWVAIAFCIAGLGWLGVRAVGASWRVTETNANDPAAVEMGQIIREQLPANAVIFCERRKGYEHLSMMFYADRTCYPLQRFQLSAEAAQVEAAGGEPYVLSFRDLPLPVVHRVSERGPKL